MHTGKLQQNRSRRSQPVIVFLKDKVETHIWTQAILISAPLYVSTVSGKQGAAKILFSVFNNKVRHLVADLG